MTKNLFLIVVFCLFMACAKHPIIPVIQKSESASISYEEEGIASWYGGKFHGRKTASGEKFNKNNFTCAHRTLPFGTILEVTNLDNENKVTVRVTDRGPAIKSRLIDVSQAAAKVLQMIRTGTARVRVIHYLTIAEEGEAIDVE